MTQGISGHQAIVSGRETDIGSCGEEEDLMWTL
jgi:hypothetical protein